MFPRLLIIDGSSLLHEAYYGTIPEQMKREKDRSKWHLWYHQMMQTKSGFFTNGIYTAMNRMERIIKGQDFTHALVAYDIPGDITFRKKLYPEYKGKREAADKSFVMQNELYPKLLSDLGIPVFTAAGYEADDCIGSLVKKFKGQIPIVILSGDKDMAQLVEKDVQLWFSCKKQGQAEAMFEELFEGTTGMTLSQYHLPDKIFPVSKETVPHFMGVGSCQVADLKTISGDPSDNYPGIAGIGQKGAIALLKYFGSLQDIISFVETTDWEQKEQVTEIKETFKAATGTSLPVSKLRADTFKEEAVFYQKLANIYQDLAFTVSLNDCKLHFNNDMRKKWYHQLEFYSLLNRRPYL